MSESERAVGLSEIGRVFLKIGAMSYGGPAIMGFMQAEILEKRQWMGKERFVEGLGLVNLLPGPGATQLAIFLGHAKAGVAGGILAGLCFILPAFAVMLALTVTYVAFGALPSVRNAFYGIGPVVLGIFVMAVFRLAKSVIRERAQVLIALGTAAVVLLTPAGVVTPLLAAGFTGVALFHSRRMGLIGLVVLLIAVSAAFSAGEFLQLTVSSPAPAAELRLAGDTGMMAELAAFFLKVGAFTFGGGLSMLAFIEEQVVRQLGWLTPREFVDGLALGQLTPGPVLMLAAFIGFKLAGVKGAAVAASAIFLPSFVMMLSILPLLRRMRHLQGLQAFMRGVAPAVIGALAISLLQMAPHAAPDVFTSLLLALTVLAIFARNLGPLPLMLSGGLAGWLVQSRVWGRVRDLLP
jgi:chromate transporter